MKKFMVVLCSIFLVTILAMVSFSWAHRWGSGGGHMMGNWGENYSDRGEYSEGYRALTDEQKVKLEALDKKFYDETADLRNKMRTKSNELNTLLNSEDPDVVMAKSIQKEINDSSAELDLKGLEYQLEARKIVPDTGFSNGYGMGFGHHMWGGNPQMGFMRPMRGNGPGSCWN